MKWYEDPVYIKQCEKATEIQLAHWECGWSEGDYFWDGEKVCLCGMDYLNVLNYFKDGRSFVRFAMREPLTPIVFKQDFPTSAIAMMTGKYELKTLYNGIWLPYQHQLQDMLRHIDKFDTSIQSITIACNFARFIGIDDEDEEGRSNIHIRKGSMEQLWMAFVMKELYSKIWNGEDWVK
jgi:hypothetical protein